MPIYNQYKITYNFPDKDPIIKTFDSRNAVCEALDISLPTLYKIIKKEFSSKSRPHLNKEFISIDVIETERAYLSPKEPINSKKLNEGFEKMQKILTS